MSPVDDLAQAFDDAVLPAPVGNGKGQPDEMELAIRAAIAAGTIDPRTALPDDTAERLLEWARFVSRLEPVERELRISDKLAVLSSLSDNFREIVAAAMSEADRERRESSGGERESLFIDWSTFWAEEEQQEWIYKNILARGRGHAIYAVHKGGKSLLSLFMAADIATSGLGASCLYLDYEMTASDVRERLRDMGYGPETDFSHLHYALLPTLPPLDTEEGGLALAALVDGITSGDPTRHVTVIIDTISRAVWGEENSADTWRLFYVHTGLRLKQRGATWLRLDHGGKDSAKGQRGSSGKGDDVDVVWKLSPTEGGITLTRELSRMSWVPEKVTMMMQDFPLCYLPAVFDYPEGTAMLANILDRAGVALDASVRKAGTALREIDEGRRHDVVSAALKWRRDRAAEILATRANRSGEQPGEQGFQTPQGTGSGTSGEQASFSLGNAPGNSGNRTSGMGGEQSPPSRGGTVHHATESIDIGDMP